MSHIFFFCLEVKREAWNVPDLELLVLQKPCCTHKIMDTKAEQGQALALPTTTHAIVPLGLLVLEIQQACISQRLLSLHLKNIRRWKEKAEGRREMFKESLGKTCFLKGETTESVLLLYCFVQPCPAL